MAEMRPRLLQDFLVPHLNNETFRDKLCWIDRNERTFRIFWRHQSSSRFSSQDSTVFQEWAVMKNLWDPSDPKCLTKAKQRLRAALLKLKSVKCIQKENESRIYKIVSYADTRESDEDSRGNNENFRQRPHFEDILPRPHFEDILPRPNFEDIFPNLYLEEEFDETNEFMDQIIRASVMPQENFLAVY